MNARQISPGKAQRKSVGAFFRWQAPGEPIAVHLHLNVVDLLGRDAIRSGKAGVAGILLGRVEHNRKPTLIVEDYQTAASLLPIRVSESAPETGGVFDAAMDHWNSGSEKRISVLGFYRSCGSKAICPDEHDLKLWKTHPDESDKLLLLIETHVSSASRGTLFMIRNGAVAWKWQPISFNRRELTDNGTPFPASIATFQDSDRYLPLDADAREAALPTGNRQKASDKSRWTLGIVSAVALLATILLLLHDSQFLRTLTFPVRSTDQHQILGLKLQRNGNDWKLDWDRNSPALRQAVAGHLMIEDGVIHKNLDLNTNELLSGSLTYTPVTDDVTLHLEVVNANSKTLASESVRIVTALLPPDQAAATGSRISREHFSDSPSLDGLRTPPPTAASHLPAAGQSKAPASAPVAKWSMPQPTVSAARPKPPNIIDFEDIVTQQNSASPMPLAGSTVQRDAPLAPPEVFPSSTELPRKSLPARDGAAHTGISPSSFRPAQLIARKEPVYPPWARTAHLTGTVDVEFRVNEKGAVENVKAIVVKGPAMMGPAAADAVKQWQFKPAEQDGIPVASESRTTFVFTLD